MMDVMKWLCLFMFLWGTCEAAYVAEGYFVVDRKAFKIYINERTETDATAKEQKALEEMKKDIGYLLTEVNRLFATLKPRGLDIQIKVRQLEFLKNDVFDAKLLNGIDILDDDALTSFDKWLDSTGAYKKYGYDFATLWSGYNVQGTVAGYAHIGTVCDSGSASSVVEFNATYVTAEVTAHEIAHILGASHDGAASQKIMAAEILPEQIDRWTFSVCSEADIMDYVSTLKSNCLSNTSSLSTTPSVTRANYTGRMLDANSICERALNDTRSYMCQSKNLYQDAPPKGDIVCSYIYCDIPGTDLCHEVIPSEGLICDAGKRCDSGTCVADSTAQAKNADGNCLWGDMKVISLTSPDFLGTCAEYMARNGVGSCYDKVIYSLCCGTCNSHRTGPAGCEYGDESGSCKNYSPQAVCSNPTNVDLCCNTCKNYVSSRSLLLGRSAPVQVEKQSVSAVLKEKQALSERLVLQV